MKTLLKLFFNVTSFFNSYIILYAILFATIINMIKKTSLQKIHMPFLTFLLCLLLLNSFLLLSVPFCRKTFGKNALIIKINIYSSQIEKGAKWEREVKIGKKVRGNVPTWNKDRTTLHMDLVLTNVNYV